MTDNEQNNQTLAEETPKPEQGQEKAPKKGRYFHGRTYLRRPVYHVKRKEVLVPLLTAAGIAVLLLALGESIILSATSGFFRRSEKTGSRSFARGDYETAIQSYKDALAENPKDEQVRQDLQDAYISYSQMYTESGDYNNAVILLRQGRTVLSGADAITSELASVYQSWAESLSSQGNFSNAVSVLSAGSGYGDMTASYRKVYLAWADSAEQAGNFDNALTVCENGQKAAGGEDLQNKAEEIEAIRRLSVLAAQSSIPVHLSSDLLDLVKTAVINHDGVCQYPDQQMALYLVNGQVMLYRGAIENGQRTGTGSWENVSVKGADSFRYVCTFENDAPNGQFSYEMTRSNGVSTAVTGEAKDGLYSGTCLVTDYNGTIWETKYQDGLPQEKNTSGSGSGDTESTEEDRAAQGAIADGTADAGTSAGAVTAGEAVNAAGRADTAAAVGTSADISVPASEAVLSDTALNETSSGYLTIERNTMSYTRGIFGWGDQTGW